MKSFSLTASVVLISARCSTKIKGDAIDNEAPLLQIILYFKQKQVNFKLMSLERQFKFQ